MSIHAFKYEPICSAPGCGCVAVFKIAAVWSDGSFQELKTYGFACAAHRESLCAQAELRRGRLRLADGESVEAIGAYRLERGSRDAALSRIDG